MSAIAALKGYRTQFLYSLHFILSNLPNNFIFRLEGEEDLDILDSKGQLLYAIQLKNLGKTITLSDILSENKTSFIKRFLDRYPDAIPMLVSYGEISQEIKKWGECKDSISKKEKSLLSKYKITADNWKLVKNKTQLIEINEETVAEEVEKMMKDNFQLIDPIPTVGFVLNWLQIIAEEQRSITKKDFYSKIEDFGKYLTERIAVHDQYGLVLKPLHKVSTENVNQELLEKEFYKATLTRYEHILLGLDVNREKYLEQVNSELKDNNIIIVKGASGQGKTALLYSYVHRYGNDMMSFELNIQQDSISTQKSIQTIASISKKLGVPTFFLINVRPNTTEWLQIVKESAYFNHIKFLIAIRNEDWYRASAVGIEFEHKEIDLVLSKEEAEIMYSKLNDKNKINHFTDFDEAWIKLGNNSPLLEFVYSITQGDSLHNKLNLQVQQILKEGGVTNNQQIEFLRIVSLADSLGARIDISKLDSNFDYQFVIKKLENEYLIKKTSDRKHIQGLHVLRSQTLVEILFDEFSNSKEEYGYKCISLIVEEDLYLFMLQLFYIEIFAPSKFIKNLNKLSNINWSIYTCIIKAFIWVGTREYVESNRKVIDECRKICGAAWMMFMDFTFGGFRDINGMLDLLKIDKERRGIIEELNNKLLPKNDVFNLASDIINKLEFPQNVPYSEFEWRSFGETLFWLKNIKNQKKAIPIFSESEFEMAFNHLNSKNLSKLMLGMCSYSPTLDKIRKKYVKYFIDTIKSDFDIIHLSVDEDDVNVHYIIDILKNEDKRSSNDFVVNILDILRTAFPDKKKFNSQGHGHRLQTLSLDYDETHKTMPIENLPLEEWVNINFSIIQLYEYKYRPLDWNEYRSELNQWEVNINDKINEFNKSFNQLFKGSKTYAPVIPVLNNILFNRPEKIKEPKSITDPLGIYGGKKRETNPINGREEVNITLQSKYEKFFKSISDFKTSIETFVPQSAQTLTSRIKLKTEEVHIHDENIERLSQTNLYDAIGKLKDYNDQYRSIFGNIDSKHTTKIEFNVLLTTATLWKGFLSNNFKGEHSDKRILKLKLDFENKIIKDCKQVSRTSPFSIKYINNIATNYKPILVIDSGSPFCSLLGMKEAYNIVQEAIDNPEYTSLKFLMLQLWFSNIYFAQTIHNRTINNQWIEVRLYNIKDKVFEELSTINFIPQLIDSSILDNLKIESWMQQFPEFNEIIKTSEAYSKMILLVDHFYDLNFFDEINLDDSDQQRLKDYIGKIGFEIQQSLQAVLDALVVWFEMFPFDEATYIENEEEQEYFRAIINIKDNIFPQPKGDEENYQIVINKEIISVWVDRLKVCTENWGIFLLLLYGKYIDKYNGGLDRISLDPN
jgi:hypothetical protein